MKKLGAALLILLGLASAALAQSIAPPLNAVVGGCAYNTTTPTLSASTARMVQCDKYGNLIVTGNTNIPTYGAAVTALANVAAGDVYCITGSATKTVRVKGIRVSAVATAAIVGDVSIILRSTLSSGGGLASVPVVKLDQNNPAATAVVNSFTSAPTPGTSIGTIRSRKIAAATQGNAATTSEGLFQFTVYYDQPIVLRGATQAACVNASAFGAGASWDIDSEHTEE